MPRIVYTLRAVSSVDGIEMHHDECNDLAFTLQATFLSEVLEAIKAAGALFQKHTFPCELKCVRKQC